MNLFVWVSEWMNIKNFFSSRKSQDFSSATIPLLPSNSATFLIHTLMLFRKLEFFLPYHHTPFTCFSDLSYMNLLQGELLTEILISLFLIKAITATVIECKSTSIFKKYFACDKPTFSWWWFIFFGIWCNKIKFLI